MGVIALLRVLVSLSVYYFPSSIKFIVPFYGLI